jgi:YD repeat-containing protein
MSKRNRLCAVFLNTFSFLCINLIAVNIAQAQLTISGSKQMSTGGTQTLTATGGSGGYAWMISSGGGSIPSTSGASATYTAPPTNPYCGNNPKICVIDDTGKKACMGIAVNAVIGDAGYTGRYCRKIMEGGYCSGQYFAYPFKCNGSVVPLESVCSTGYSQSGCNIANYESIQANLCAQASSTLRCPSVTRTDAQKAAGCCPWQLSGGSDGGSDSGGMGAGCGISVPAGSSVNFKSGNLYHEQDVAELTLSYNSIDTNNGTLGKKWTHNYDLKLDSSREDTTLVLKEGDGNIIYFRNSGGVYYPEARSGDTSRIVRSGNWKYTRTAKNGTIHEFTSELPSIAPWLLTSIKDKNGNTTALTYNGNVLASITDPNGRTTTITSTSGKITGINDPAGRNYSLAYTGDLLTSITDPVGNTWQYTYDTTGHMLTKKNPANLTVTYIYDTDGRILRSTDPEGKTRTMNYTQSGLSTLTEKDSGFWTYAYDPVYAIKTAENDALGNTTRYTYDLKRNRTSFTASDGSVTRYTYDANGNRTSVTDPLGKTTSYTYNALNLVTSRTDSLGHVTQYGYDAKGNLTSITDAANAVTGFQYDGKGNVTSITTPLNKTTTMAYDAANNLVSVTDPNSGTVTMTYDAVGNMLTQTDALSNTTTFQYNSLNQLVQVTDPQGNVTAYTYDYNGNRLTATDANSKLNQYAYNFKDQLTQMIDPLNNITALSYSGAGCASCGTGVEKLTAVTDAKTHMTVYEYDRVGNLIKETDPLGKITTYTYDGKGNLLTRTSPDHKTITYSYDLNNRLTQKQDAGGAVTTFQYDAAGNMTAAGNGAISYALTYDANHRITQITDSNARTIEYQYAAAGNRSQMITPDGRTLTYDYDNNSRLAQLTAPLGSFTFAYDAANRRTSRTYPNGTSSSYSYNAPSRLLGIQTTKGAAALDSVAYTYDPASNRLTKTPPQESWTFAYDDLYRLTQANPTGGIHRTETYTYDAVGNRLSSEEVQPPTGSETQNYTYDAENRLTGVQVIKNGSTRELAFAYDPFGRRIAKTIVRDEIGTECASPNVCPRTINYVYDPEFPDHCNEAGGATPIFV